MENHQLINQNSGCVEWFTPRPIVQAASSLMGGITLDPACSVAAYAYQLEHSEAYHWERGLSLPWYGKVWLNPPFGGTIKDWIFRLTKFHKQGRIEQACCIAFNSTETDWGQMLLPYPQFFFRRRVNYVQGGKPEPGKEKPGSTKGSILTYLPPQGMSYGEALNKLLSVMESKGFNGWAK
jgi:hypothetical protein